jgi:hypothetical protein
MRRKRLKHYADVICKMFMGWRMIEDLEILASLPDGRIVVNLIAETTSHDKVGMIDLHITKEIHAWLKNECEREAIDFSQLQTAKLTVDVNTSHISTKRQKIVCFGFSCHSLIETDEGRYSSDAIETHKWHRRIQPSV